MTSNLPVSPSCSSTLNQMPEPEPEPEFCSSSLLFLQDVNSGREVLVSSNTSVLSLFMFPRPKSTSSDGVCLLTADRSPLVCSGTKIIPLHFSCGPELKFIPGHSSLLWYQFLSWVLIFCSILIFSSTSTEEELSPPKIKIPSFSISLLHLSPPSAMPLP